MGSVINQAFNLGTSQASFSVDVSSGAAVVTVHGDNWTCTKTGTGTYTFVYANRQGIMMKELMSKWVDWTTAAASALFPQMLSIVQAGGRDGLDITVVVALRNSAGAATDTAVAGTISAGFETKVTGGTFTSPI
jgi:hypothetical protein